MLKHSLKAAKMPINKVSLVIFYLSTSILLFQTLTSLKGGVDEWYLAGIFMYFIFFIIAFILAVSTSSIEMVTVFSSLFFMVAVLLPNLKYQYILDPFDASAHYGSIKATIENGQVTEVTLYKTSYQHASGSRIILAIISMILGIDIDKSITLFLASCYFSLPMIFYFASKKLIISEELSKWVIILVPISFLFRAYIFNGIIFAQFFSVFLYLLVLTSYLNNDFKAVLMSFLVSLSVLFFHDYTTFSSLMLLLLMELFFRMFRVRAKFFILSLIIIYLSYFIYLSISNFAYIITFIANFAKSLYESSTPHTFEWYSTFFELSLVDRLKLLTIRFSRDLLLVLISLGGFISFIINRKYFDKRQKMLYQIFFGIFAFNILLYVMIFLYWRIGYRIFVNSQFTIPFTGSLISIFKFKNSSKGGSRSQFSIAAIIFLTILYSVSMIGIYPYQPLVPKISTIFGNFYVSEHREIVTVNEGAILSFVNRYDESLPIYSPYWTVYRFMDSRKMDLIRILEMNPIEKHVSRNSLVVMPLSPEEGKIIYASVHTYFDNLMKIDNSYATVYSNGKWCLVYV